MPLSLPAIGRGSRSNRIIKTLGTILPTVKGLRSADNLADRMIQKNDTKARRTFPDAERRIVDGEIRYYTTRTIYTPVTLSPVRRWFEVRSDGHYAIPDPQ